MKFFLPTLGVLFLAALGTARAQENDPNEQMAAPPDEIITDFGIEEYVAIPKYSLSLGVRTMTGAKIAFSGTGYISSNLPNNDITTPNANHIYHDGNVLTDTSPVTFQTTNGDGTVNTFTGGITPPGYTNNWSFIDSNQFRADGSIDMHSYFVNIADSGVRQSNPGAGSGAELVITRDMGNLTKRIAWKLFFGVSLNDIKSSKTDTLDAMVTTVTDNYAVNLNGFAVPTGPYIAPHFVTVPRVDASGNPVYDTSGTQYIDYVDQTVFSGNVPLGRTTTTMPGTVSDHWELKGAYMTFRAGPTIDIQVSDHFHAKLSFGAALIFAGTTYTVDQTFTPDVADALVSTASQGESKFLPGYYADATLQYDFSEQTGLYAGVVYQKTGSYTETASLNDVFTGSTADYKALVDLTSLQGFRMGMSFKF